MVIQELSAVSFRNFSELRIRFSERINVISGLNGHGKTNLAEAIHFLSHLDSFRTHRMENLIAKGQSVSQIQGFIRIDEIERKTRIEISHRGRKVEVDNHPIPTISTYISNYFSFVFNPDNLYLFRHIPAERRWLVNRYLSFVSSGYLKSLREFRFVQAQKNQLLRRGELAGLPAWNQLLAERSNAILIDRMALAQRVSPLLSDVFSQLTGRRESLWLELRPSLNGSAREMTEVLARAREAELRAGHALLGPHRDDVRLVLKGRGSDALFSQGEYRAALLALQFGLGRLMEAERGFRPVLILDDVFSELDAATRERLLQYLTQLPNQIFLTTTEWPPSMHVPGARVMEIRSGHVTVVKE